MKQSSSTHLDDLLHGFLTYSECLGAPVQKVCWCSFARHTAASLLLLQPSSSNIIGLLSSSTTQVAAAACTFGTAGVVFPMRCAVLAQVLSTVGKAAQAKGQLRVVWATRAIVGLKANPWVE